MTLKRRQQVKDIYESIIIQEAASIDTDEWINKLLEEKTQKDIPEEEKPKSEEEPFESPELPGQLREVEYPKQTSMFPGSEKDLPFVKRYAPSSSLFTECPVCKSKVDPIEKPKGGKNFIYREECPKCKQLYNKIMKLMEEHGLSEAEAINAARTKRYDINILKTILDSGGSSNILETPIQQDLTPSIGKRVEDALRFRLNVQKDAKGNIKTDPQGFPIPAYPPKFMTTHQLAKQLRWHPDHLVSFLEEKGFSPIPIGGIGSADMPSRAPLEKDQTENERRLRALQLLLKRIKNPQVVLKDLQEELQHLNVEYSKLQAPGGPGTPGLNPRHPSATELPPEVREERMNAIKRSIIPIKKKIRDIQEEMRGGVGNKKLENEIEQEIKQLESTIKEENVPGKERFKTSWYNIWNMDAIKDAIKERELEIENIIRPLEKVQYFGRKAKYYEQAVGKFKEQVERLTKEKEQLKDNLEVTERKAFQLLFKYRNADEKSKKTLSTQILKTIGFNAETLEKSYGKDLDRYIRLQQLKSTQIETAERKIVESEERAKDYTDKFVELTGDMGFEWVDEKGNKIRDKETLLAEITKNLDQRTEEIPPKEASVKLAGKQLSLFEEEEELPSGGGTLFFGTDPKKQSEELAPEEPEPEIEEPVEPTPETPDESQWTFGLVSGMYYYRIHGVTPTGEDLKYSGRFQFTPGHKFESANRAVASKLPSLVAKHGIAEKEGAKFKITIKSPKKRSQTFSFHIEEGAPKWHGSRMVKTKLLDKFPDLKKLWSAGMLSIDDIVEFDGKLYDIHDLGKSQESERKVFPRATVIVPPTLEEQIKQIEIDLQDESLAPEDRKRLESELSRLQIRLERRKGPLISTDEEEEEKFTPRKRRELKEITPREPVEFTAKCPYEGCDASIPEDAKSCWKCKSPIGTSETTHKVVSDTMRMEKEVEVTDPVTQEKHKETKVFFVPQYSLITIELDTEGKPRSAKCESVPEIKRPYSGGRRDPTFKKLWTKTEKQLAILLADPKISEKKKEELKTKKDFIYEWFVKKQKEEGKIDENKEPWRTPPAVGAPTKPCKKCPKKVLGPFDEQKLKQVCPEIAKAIKSLSKPVAGVEDYAKMRLVTEKELKRDVDKGTKGIESKPWYLADDKKASRFDKIKALLN